MALHPVRSLFYALLFIFSIIMLGLTSYEIHLTKSSTATVLNPRGHYYDPTVVALLVTSILALLWSLWMLCVLIGRLGAGGITSYAMELCGLFVLWTMFLVCAAVFTHKFLHLKSCRSHFRLCRVLETIKAFSWMCFIFLTFLIILSLFNMRLKRHGPLGPAHGRADAAAATAAYPHTRETKTTRDGPGPGPGVVAHDNVRSGDAAQNPTYNSTNATGPATNNKLARENYTDTRDVNGNALSASHNCEACGGPGAGNVQQSGGTNIV